MPKLSTHLSFKPVLESYAKFAHEGDKIGKYRIEGKGSNFYSKQTMVDLQNQPAVVQFLADKSRVFAMVNADELAALDAALKQGNVPYYVVDASSSRFLLLTNRLEGKERDENPLRQHVWTPPPENPAATPPWPTRVPVTATFGDAIELVGADFPRDGAPPGQDPARPRVPGQGPPAGELQDLPPLRRSGRTPRDRRSRSRQPHVRDQLLAARASTCGITTRPTSP